MKHTLLKTIPCALALAVSQQAFAQPPKFVDARSFAMGGVGVASATPTSAMFFNPALMAAKHLDERDSFGVVVPSIHLRAADDNDVRDELDDIETLIDEFERNLNEIETAGAISDELKNRSLANAQSLNDALGRIDEDAIRVDAGLALGFVFPDNEGIAWGIMANTSIRSTILANYEDQAKFNTLITELSAANPVISDTNTDLASDGRVLAAAQTQVGVALATSFNVGGNPLMVGVTPKFVSIDTYHYAASMNTFDQDNDDDGTYETYERTFNLDVGVAMQFGETQQWTVGVAVLDLIPMEVKTLQYNLPMGSQPSRQITAVNVEYNPTIRAGIAHNSEWHTIAVDLDITKNEGFGQERDEQWLAVGAEFDAWDTVQLRAGIRQNIASSDSGTSRDLEDGDTQVTAGIGFTPVGIRIDISALASENEVGAAAELGFAF